MRPPRLLAATPAGTVLTLAPAAGVRGCREPCGHDNLGVAVRLAAEVTGRLEVPVLAVPPQERVIPC